MQTLLSIIVITVLLVLLASLKVLLRTNLMLALSVIAGSGAVLGICWWIYQRMEQKP